MILIVLLGISILLSAATALLAASLLDYSLIELYIYTLTYFDPSDGFSYLMLALLYAPLPLAGLCLWSNVSNR